MFFYGIPALHAYTILLLVYIIIILSKKKQHAYDRYVYVYSFTVAATVCPNVVIIVLYVCQGVIVNEIRTGYIWRRKETFRKFHD